MQIKKGEKRIRSASVTVGPTKNIIFRVAKKQFNDTHKIIWYNYSLRDFLMLVTFFEFFFSVLIYLVICDESYSLDK